MAQIVMTAPVTARCLPSGVHLIARAATQSRKQLRSGCTVNASGVVPCSPDTMRARTEAQLQAMGYTKGLSLEQYAMARNIHSEAGSGTPAEKLAIGEALVNRARAEGRSMMSLITRGGYFAAQSGCNPCASSRQDPTLADIVAAEIVLSGKSNITAGATHYFSPRTQDALHRAGRTSKSARQVYDSWASGGDLLTWVGYVPGIDLGRQMFLKRLPKTTAGRMENRQMFSLGQNALGLPTPNSVLSPPTCTRKAPAFLAATAGAALGAASYFLFERLRG